MKKVILAICNFSVLILPKEGFIMRSIANGLIILAVTATIFGIIILLSIPVTAQFDRNWKREIDWAGRIYAGISRCSSNNSEYRFLQDRLAESVGAYMKYHTVASEAIDYYPIAIKAAMLDIDKYGVNCSIVRSDLESFRRKHGTYAAPK